MFWPTLHFTLLSHCLTAEFFISVVLQNSNVLFADLAVADQPFILRDKPFLREYTGMR